jgi:hypothetical protein
MPKKKRAPARPNEREQPPAKLVPLTNPNKEFIGSLRGIFKIVGDIESPLDPPEAWEYD